LDPQDANSRQAAVTANGNRHRVRWNVARPGVSETETTEYYCPACNQPVSDPLVCGDCASLICRRCGTPLEKADELGIG